MFTALLHHLRHLCYNSFDVYRLTAADLISRGVYCGRFVRRGLIELGSSAWSLRWLILRVRDWLYIWLIERRKKKLLKIFVYIKGVKKRDHPHCTIVKVFYQKIHISLRTRSRILITISVLLKIYISLRSNEQSHRSAPLLRLRRDLCIMCV